MVAAMLIHQGINPDDISLKHTMAYVKHFTMPWEEE